MLRYILFYLSVNYAAPEKPINIPIRPVQNAPVQQANQQQNQQNQQQNQQPPNEND
jgi:hypothetical protein